MLNFRKTLPMAYILALDQGTTSSRSALVDRNGDIYALEQQEIPQIFPQAGWVEHDPAVIWHTQLSTLRKVVEKAGVDVQDIEAIGIANQRETTIVWNRHTGKPIYNAIVWQDRRTTSFCNDIKAQGYAESIQFKTGLVIDAYFSATKINWILDHVQGARDAADAGDLIFGTIDTWLLYMLTDGQVHATDFSNASRTLLYNIVELDWDKELLDIFNIPLSLMPRVWSSSGEFGVTSSNILGREIPILSIAGDQQAALFGQQCVEPGMAKSTYGTGCFLLMNTGTKPIPSQSGLLTTVAWGIDGLVEYALEGSVFVAGAAVQWLRDGIGIIETAEETHELAESLAANDDVYFVPALTGLGTPHWDMNARGMLIGLTRGTTREHIVRATLEAIAFQASDVLEAMEKEGHLKLKELRVDGGAAANDFLMQFQADLLGVPVLRPSYTESTVLGVAFLAGLMSGLWTRDRLQEMSSIERRFDPKLNQKQRERLYRKWKNAIERSKGWAD
jgi:glycerol kinase